MASALLWSRVLIEKSLCVEQRQPACGETQSCATSSSGCYQCELLPVRSATNMLATSTDNGWKSQI
eukprot:6174396-Pleurochrysis_carterae.AAC.3